MDAFSIIIAVVTLIVSILQIILFFKIWKMTDDVLSLKETVNRLLYSKLPDEKRKHDAFVELFEMFWFQNAINIYQLPTSEPERWEELNKQVGFVFAREKHKTNRVLEKHVVNGIYTIEQLQSDIVNEYKKKIADTQVKLAELFKMHRNTVGKYIKSLIELGYINKIKGGFVITANFIMIKTQRDIELENIKDMLSTFSKDHYINKVVWDKVKNPERFFQKLISGIQLKDLDTLEQDYFIL